ARSSPKAGPPGGAGRMAGTAGTAWPRPSMGLDSATGARRAVRGRRDANDRGRIDVRAADGQRDDAVHRRNAADDPGCGRAVRLRVRDRLADHVDVLSEL